LKTNLAKGAAAPSTIENRSCLFASKLSFVHFIGDPFCLPSCKRIGIQSWSSAVPSVNQLPLAPREIGCDPLAAYRIGLF
jgi:hypothetical protein